MKRRTIPTGVIQPRFYGLRYKTKYGKSIFFTPMHYVKAELAMATPKVIENGLGRVAKRRGTPIAEYQRLLSLGVESKEKSKDILQFDKKHFVKNLQNYGGMSTAKVKSFDGSEEYDVQLDFPLIGSDGQLEYGRAGSTSKNKFWGKTKLKGDLVDKHIAMLHLATHPNTLPFQLKKEDAWIEMALNHYVLSESYFQVEKEALLEPDILSPRAKKALREGNAGFNVMRHKEAQVTLEKLSKEQIDFYKGVVTYRNNLLAKLRNKGFSPVGYALEFRDTPLELTAQRFRQKGSDTVFHVCYNTGILPLIVERKLGDVSDDLANPYSWADLSLSGILSGDDQDNIDDSLDDVTRRKSDTIVNLPFKHAMFKGVYVPKALAAEYEKL